MATIDFPAWLQKELNDRGWTQADLSRFSNLSTAAISRMMTGARGIGPDACLAIANALRIPPEIVFRAAGLLPPKPDDEVTLEEWLYVLDQLSEEDRDELLNIARLKIERREKKKPSAPRRKAEGLA